MSGTEVQGCPNTFRSVYECVFVHDRIARALLRDPHLYPPVSASGPLVVVQRLYFTTPIRLKQRYSLSSIIGNGSCGREDQEGVDVEYSAQDCADVYWDVDEIEERQ